MAAEENLGEMYVKIKADMADLEKDVRAIRTKLDKEIPTAKINFDTSLGKLKIAELEKYHAKLKSVFDKKIAMNADIESIRRTGSQLKQVESILNDVKTKAKDSGEELGRWGMVATGIQSVVDTFSRVKNEIKEIFGESMKIAASAEGVRIAYQRIGDDKLLDDLRTATKGAVTDLQLMQTAVRASNFDIPLSSLAKLLQFAQRRAQDTGQSVDYLVDSIVMGIGRKSPLILDNLGISAVALREKFKGISVEEAGVGAVAEAVSQIAKEELDKMGEAVVTTGDQYGRLNREIREGKENLGDMVNSALKPLLDALDETDSKTKKWFASFLAIGDVVVSLIPILAQLLALKKMIGLQSILTAQQISTETAAINANTTSKIANSKVTLGLIGKVGAIAAVGVAIWQLTSYINENTAAIKKNREEADKKYPDWDKSGFGARSFADQTNQKKGDVGLSWIQEHIDKVDKLINENQKDSEQWTLKGKTVQQVEERIKSLTDAQSGMIVGSAELLENYAEIKRLMDAINPPTKKETPYTKIPDINNKGVEQIPTPVKQLKGVETPNQPEQQQSKLQPYYDMMAGGPFEGENGFVNSVETSMAMASGFVDGFFEDIRISSEGANSLLEKGFVGMANSFITQVQRMISEWLTLQALRATFSLFGIPIPGGSEGGTFIGTNMGVKKMASGGSFIVPAGFSHDNYPMFVQTGEKVKVTPANKVGEEERLLGTLIKRMDVMNYNMIESLMQKTQRLAIDLYGEIDKDSIRLLNNKSSRIYRRYS